MSKTDPSSSSPSSSSLLAEYYPHLAAVSLIPTSELGQGEVVGGRALRNWTKVHIHGTPLLLSRQKKADNPPAIITRQAIEAYASLRHPNIVSLVARTPAVPLHPPPDLVSKDESVVWGSRVEDFDAITEICEGGDLATISKASFTLTQRLQFGLDIARALAWAHTMGVVHRDVKPSHWLVTGGQSNLRAKLGGWMFAEFQRAAFHEPPDGRFHGTPLYMAPELWGKEAFDAKKADVYSFGLSLWELVYDRQVFGHHTDLAAFRRWVVEGGERPPLQDTVHAPKAVNSLLQQCWDADPAARPTMSKVVETLEQLVRPAQVLNG
jgi:serine/threonine protein kinase